MFCLLKLSWYNIKTLSLNKLTIYRILNPNSVLYDKMLCACAGARKCKKFDYVIGTKLLPGLAAQASFGIPGHEDGVREVPSLNSGETNTFISPLFPESKARNERG